MRISDRSTAPLHRLGFMWAVALFALAFAGPAPAQSTFPLTVNMNGTGTVTSTPPGIGCNVLVPTCSASFPAGTAVTLNYVPPTAGGSAVATWGGACSGQQTCTVTMNGPQAVTATIGVLQLCPAPGESGWWWNPAEGGRGFFIDNSGAQLYFVLLGYDASGHETWYAALAIAAASGCTYHGTLATFGGGQTLTGAFKPPTTVANVGNFSLTFTDATHASVQLPGESLTLQRFIFAGNGNPVQPEGTASPFTGIYWNPQEPGRGFAIEIQNEVLYMGGYMYDITGLPVWYVVGPTPQPFATQAAQPRQRCCGPAPLTIPSPANAPFLGTWAQFAGGQVLGGPYRAPIVFSGDVGAMTLGSFRYGQGPSAVLALPNGHLINIQRFTY